MLGPGLATRARALRVGQGATAHACSTPGRDAKEDDEDEADEDEDRVDPRDRDETCFRGGQCSF